MARVGWVSLVLFLSACAATKTTAKRAPIKPHASLTACPFTACGGAVGGSYSFTDSCAEPEPATDPSCAAATGTITPNFYGSMILYNNGNYVRTVATSGNMTLNFPASCVTGQSCAQVASNLNNGGFFANVTCQSDNGGCDCTGNLQPVPVADTGNWAAANNVLTFQPSGGGLPPENDPYCVNGNTMTVQITGGATLNAQQSSSSK